MKIDQYTEVRCSYPYDGTEGDPKPGEMHVLYDAQGAPEMVNFICPCGCGNTCPTHVISMAEKNNVPASHQGPWKQGCWGFDPKTLTLSPSIRWISGCHAHFTITNGKVTFHGDSGVKP